MSNIRVLTEEVAAQIAAGEVIERPASVVKELLDNGIDAGADRLEIRIEGGGRKFIRVRDNGCGMSRDDLFLSVERHATSKIENSADLFRIQSLGFRGEALPSIAAVSRTQILSRPREQLVGHKLKLAGGRLIGIEESGAPAGTVVEVRDLFFNLPARRKFLRAVRTETNHIVDTVARAALPFGRTSFRLSDREKTIFNLPASEIQPARFTPVFGKEVAASMTETKVRTDGLLLHAFLGDPQLNRSRPDRLLVYVNGRNIRDRLINRAIIEGYGQRLMKGRCPQAVVFIQIEPSKVDVNVHPTKQEIRFRDSRTVFAKIVAMVNEALSQSSEVRDGRWPGRQETETEGVAAESLVRDPFKEYCAAAEGAGGLSRAEPAAVHDSRHTPRVLGQLNNTYILCEDANGLLVVDQHAAHERIVYENLRKSLRTSRVPAQNLLVPKQLELGVSETRILKEKGEKLLKIGIELDYFGGNSFLLRSIPAVLIDADWSGLLTELLPKLAEGEIGDDSLVEELLAVVACHGAIRAGQRLTSEEMVQLLRQLEEVDLPTNCPHGRPVYKKFTYREIEKMFKRVV
jgi:DNA mismatch repair protein MutL